jgi:hypothetical protein
MSKKRRILGLIPPILVIIGLAYFVYYSLYVYQPSAHSVCQKSVIAQQTDIAINVVRQWFGKAGEQYNGCPN